jgi:hypothetical protein
VDDLKGTGTYFSKGPEADLDPQGESSQPSKTRRTIVPATIQAHPNPNPQKNNPPESSRLVCVRIAFVSQVEFCSQVRLIHVSIY